MSHYLIKSSNFNIIDPNKGLVMKKQNIINLIKYHSEKNDIAFNAEAYEVAKVFETSGDVSIARYIMSLISNKNTFAPQSVNEEGIVSSYLQEIVPDNNAPLPLPEDIHSDIQGIVNAVGRFSELNKFLFYGPAGTGKTESAKFIAKTLGRDLYLVNYSQLIDSKLGQTAKNITNLFSELNNAKYPNKLVVLFDEIDALALDRTNLNDVREMGRVTSTMLSQLESLDPDILVIATTNLYEHLDKAFARRFDSIVDFSRYSQDDLIEIAEIILSNYLNKFSDVGRDVKLFRKVLQTCVPLPFPGDLKNIIKTALGFSDPTMPYDYIRRIYLRLSKQNQLDINILYSQKFTLREIERLTGISKSNVARKLKEVADE